MQAKSPCLGAWGPKSLGASEPRSLLTRDRDRGANDQPSLKGMREKSPAQKPTGANVKKSYAFSVSHVKDNGNQTFCKGRRQHQYKSEEQTSL